MRILFICIAIAPTVALLTACSPTVRNCPIISKDPSSNIYHLDYELLIPADCPIPLAAPGDEEKYAAARVIDLGASDFYFASVKVENSKGKRQAYQVTIFLGAPGSMFAEPRAKYTAATGTRTFDDYDIGEFRAWSQDASVTATGRTRLTYQQSSLQARLTGPEIPPAATSQTWSAPATGGVPAYQYHWYRNGSLVSTDPSYTGNAGHQPFDLRVDVTDQTWSTRSAVLRVDVNGIRASIAGPSVVYASEGGGSWSAAVVGGVQPYSFLWYVDDQLVASGSGFTGYPGQGLRELRVEAKDAAGKSDVHSVVITGLGSGNGGCDPVPPQLTCES